RYQTLSAQLTHDTPRGWYSQLQFGFTRGYIVELPAGFYNQPPLCTVCANLGALTNINYSGSPYSQGFGMVGYRWASRRSIDLETTYYGPNNAYYRPAFFVVDANGELPLSKIVSLHFTARNLTGIYDRVIQTYSSFDNPIIGTPQLVGPAAWQAPL